MEKTIVCFGDSNTHGFNAETGGRFDENTRWTRLLQMFLGSGYHVVEEGLGGRTVANDDPDGEGRSAISYIAPCLMSHKPIDLLIIMLGTNDTKRKFGNTAQTICENMRLLIEKAKSLPVFRSEPNILLLAPAPIGSGYAHGAFAADFASDCVEHTIRLAELYGVCARETGCRFLYAGDFAAVGDIDCIHLSRQSHYTLAKALAQHVPKLIP